MPPASGRAATRNDRCPLAVPVGLCSRRRHHVLILNPDPGHTDGPVNENAICIEIAIDGAVGVHNAPIRIEQQRERAVEARRGWYAGYGLSSCVISLAVVFSPNFRVAVRCAQTFPKQQCRPTDDCHVSEVEGRPVV